MLQMPPPEFMLTFRTPAWRLLRTAVLWPRRRLNLGPLYDVLVIYHEAKAGRIAVAEATERLWGVLHHSDYDADTAAAEVEAGRITEHESGRYLADIGAAASVSVLEVVSYGDRAAMVHDFHVFSRYRYDAPVQMLKYAAAAAAAAAKEKAAAEAADQAGRRTTDPYLEALLASGHIFVDAETGGIIRRWSPLLPWTSRGMHVARYHVV
jgi:hypothetical protein